MQNPFEEPVLLKGVYDGRAGRSINRQGWQEKHRKAWSVPFKGLGGLEVNGSLSTSPWDGNFEERHGTLVMSSL